jgi:hypothetical protein
LSRETKAARDFGRGTRKFAALLGAAEAASFSYAAQLSSADGDIYWRPYFLSFVLLGAWPVAGFMGIDVAIFPDITWRRSSKSPARSTPRRFYRTG